MLYFSNFPSSYLVESDFNWVTNLLSQVCNWLDVVGGDDPCLSLTTLQQNTQKLCPNVNRTKEYSNIYPTRCKVTQLILSGNCSTCFGWYHHPSSAAQTTVSTASGICHTVTATCRYRGRVGTGLSVLWVAYATHSTLKLVPTGR